MSEVFTYHEGSTPLLISFPHDGTELPAEIADRMTDEARTLPDTDWHVAKLYDFAEALGAHRLIARQSRYVVDLNRPPDDASLYPGQAGTGLVPTTQFDGTPLYREGQEPTPEEIADRRDAWWRPYHDFLAERLDRLRAEHGHALLLDAHTIRSEVPRLFDGRLPDFNIGTAGGSSAQPALTIRLALVCQDAGGFETAVNGRFKGGYITRHYGDPASGIDAVQMELSQIAYMNEDPPYAFDEAKAAKVRPVLKRFSEKMIEWGARK